MRIIISLTFLMFILSIHTQTPGYMGRRFSIEGDVNVLAWHTNIIKGNYRRYTLEQLSNPSDGDREYKVGNKYYKKSLIKNKGINLININLKSSLSINYSINDKVDINGRFEYTKSKFVLSNFKTIRKSQNDHIPFIYSDQNKISYHLLEYSINFKLYTSDFIAPVGNYFLVGIGLSQAFSSYDLSYIYTQPNESVFESTTVKAKTTFIKFNIGYYKKLFVNDNLYFNLGGELNSYCLGKFHYLWDISDEEMYKSDFSSHKNIDLEIKNNYRYNIGRHIDIDNKFNFKIGIGIIL